jgi:hypothetical protein
MSTFSSILNKYCEGFMVPELDCSFFGSFRDSFSRSSLSPGFLSDPIYEFESPTSLISLSLLARVAMRRDIL